MRVVLGISFIIVAGLAGLLAIQKWWPSGTGTIVVFSEPPGAQVWLDLMATSEKANPAILRVKSGQHSVSVRQDTLEADPFAIAVNVRSGKTDTIRFRLVPPQNLVARADVPQPKTISLPPSPEPVLPVTAEIPAGDKAGIGSPSDASRLLLPPKTAPVLPPADERPMAGVVEISSTLLGASIYLNDSLLPEVTPATVTLSPGTYSIRVTLDGYTADPVEQKMRVIRSSSPQFLFVTLKENLVPLRELRIETSPVSGPIYVDSVLVGEGAATMARDLGTYQITYGDLEGFHTPPPVTVAITPTNPRPVVRGTYTRIFRISVQADGENSTTTEGDVRWETGVYADGKAKPSPSLGPRIREIPGSQKFGWELAAGDPNRNPVGGDYIEFIFTLPSDVPADAALGLRLYLYRSGRRYPLTMSSTSDLAITVNGRKFLDGYRPTHTVTAADYERYEEWSLQGLLKAGENRIMIRTSDENTLYHHLWKCEVR